MSDWSLQRLRRALRGLGVWLAWVAISGRLTHGKSYGELKRVHPGRVALNLGLMALALSTLAFLVTQMPRGGRVFVLGFGAISVFLGCTVVGASLLVTRVLDYLQAR